MVEVIGRLGYNVASGTWSRTAAQIGASGAVAGDLLVVVISSNGPNQPNTSSTGWVRLFSLMIGSGTGRQTLAAFVKIAAGSDDLSVTGGGDPMAGFVWAIRGGPASTSDLLSVVSASTPSLTAPEARPYLAILGASSAAGGDTYSMPSGWVQVRTTTIGSSANSGTPLAAAERLITNAPTTVSASVGGDYEVGCIILVPGVAEVSGAPIEVLTASGWAAHPKAAELEVLTASGWVPA